MAESDSQRSGRGGARACAIILSALLGLVAAPVSAIASEWWYVNSGPGRVLFVDAQSIERKKDAVDYWTMHVIRPGEPEVMRKSHMRADCGKRRLTLLRILRYDEQGQIIADESTRPVPAQVVAPDTLGDAELRFACGDEGHRVANGLFPMAVDEVAFAEVLIAHGNNPRDAHEFHEAMASGDAQLIGEEASEQALVPVEVPLAETGDVQADDDVKPDDAAEAAAEIKQLEDACATGTAGSCAELGTRFADGKGVTRDPERAAFFYDKACAGGDGDSCTLLGIAYHKGNGVARSPEHAAASFARACELGGAASCGNFGLALVNGDGVAKDAPRAFAYFMAACKSGSAASCSSLGAAYSMGVGVKANAGRAKRWFKKSCDANDAGGCYNLGVVYDQGLGVRKNPARAAALYVGACDQDDGAACGNLGMLVQSGSGVAKDAVRAGQLFRKSCELEDADGCLNLGRAYQAGSGLDRDVEQAALFYRKALAIEPNKADAQRALAELSAN